MSGSFDELVAEIDSRASEPLERIDAAVAAGSALVARADRLVDTFVAQARQAGHSWTEIGARLGISKQAARQQFAVRTEPDVALRPRLQVCLTAAERLARDEGAAEVGSQHVLAGLMAEGMAAATLESLGVTAGSVREAAHRLFGPPSAPVESTPPHSAEVVAALTAAARNAGGVAGTEHVLAVLALDPGSRARRVLNDLGVDIAALKRELACYVQGPTPRRRRWWRHRVETPACSFCGSPQSLAGHLVSGPGVRICRRCVEIAVDVLGRHGTDA